MSFTQPRPLVQRFLLPALLLINLLLFLRLIGAIPEIVREPTDPARLNLQISTDRIEILPGGN